MSLQGQERDLSAYNHNHNDQFNGLNGSPHNGSPHNDWQALIQHQAQITQVMNQREREIKAERTKYMKEELDKMLNQKQSFKNHQLEEDRRRDADYVTKAKTDFDQDQLRRKQQKIAEQRHLAEYYDSQHQKNLTEQQRKKEEERRIEEQMIHNSKNLLEQEKLAKKRQLDDYRQSVTDLLRDRDHRKQMEKDYERSEKLKYSSSPVSDAVTEKLKRENYQHYYNNWEDKSKRIEDMHHQYVLKDQRVKEKKYEDFVQKGIQDQHSKTQFELDQQHRRNEANRNSLNSILKSQIDYKERAKLEEKLNYPHKAEKVVQESSAYQKHLDSLKYKKNEQQKTYKEYLDQQAKEHEERRRQAQDMSEQEKRLNQRDLERFKHSEMDIDTLVPGVSRSQLNYLVSPNRSQSNKFLQRGQEPGSNLMLPPPHQNSNRRNTIEQVGDHSPIGYGVQNKEPWKSPSSGVNQSVEVNQPNYNRRQQHNISAGPYNPITNPIPNHNQNPYFRRHREATSPKDNFLAMTANKNILS